MRTVIRTAVMLLFATSFAYFAWRVSDSKFFEEVFYFGFKPCLWIGFFVTYKHYRRLRWYLLLALIQISVSIAWEVWAAFDWDQANQGWVIWGCLFGITCLLVCAMPFEREIKYIINKLFRRKQPG